MTPSPLAQMQPIILPPEPTLWPLAIGWWLLIITITISLVLTIRSLIKYRQFWSCRRQNITQAKQLTDPNALNRLLKQTALHYYPRHQVAKLSGLAWSDFLKHNLQQPLHQQCDAGCLSLYQTPSRNNNTDLQVITLAWLANLNTKSIREHADDRI
ncbi:MAG: DUF4381 domain-containing protein [Gammaproteobacteria bacterium]|nr:DUF4381 domain-containing protein [Gammaproteobacteria bacterium]